MKLFTNIKKLQKEIKSINSINFIPTMGALHKGHESLIKKSVRESKITIVSIFVNPKQFDNKKDFKNYPKNLRSDINKIKKMKVSYLYKPRYKDIYNFKPKNKIFLDNFSKKLCGKFRRGHFNGMINVVNRLIEIIRPKKIFLGMKDFQQLIIIKKHFKKRRIRIKIISCKTIRDKNFIAYSSRIKRLKHSDKNKLISIVKILKNYKRDLILRKINYNFRMIKNKVLALGAKKVDYIEVLDLKTLKKPKNFKRNFNLFFAFYIGKVRFIDNF